MEQEKGYSNGEITVVWKAHLCQHSGICVKLLPQVYNPMERPWIKPELADSVAPERSNLTVSLRGTDLY